MFKLQRAKNLSSPRSGERVDFKFSNFQALQVPKGWDRLFLSVISVESGKPIAKLGKGTVRNGICIWTETLLESVWISREDSSTHDLEECLFKFVISMGSSRAGILGEAIINFSCYTSVKTSSSVSCPLTKCSFGTVLQFKVQCLTPKVPLRNGNQNSVYHEKGQPVEYHDTGYKHNTSDDTFANGVRTTFHGLGSTSNHVEYNSKGSSNPKSGSSKPTMRADGPIRREFNSDHNLHSDGFSPHQRHAGVSLKVSSPGPHYLASPHSSSSQSSCNSEEMSPRMELESSGKESSTSSTGTAGSRNLLEAAEGTIGELRAEAKMWERNARKLMLDLDILRKEFLDQSKKQADVVMELSASYTEQDALKKEIENLKLALEESTAKQSDVENSNFQYGSQALIQKELESEVKFQQETSANLALQLKRSQESNIELLGVLQELEETIEQQNSEIQNLRERDLYTQDDNPTEKDLSQNKDLLLQLQQLQESEKALQTRVQFLEKASQDRVNISDPVSISESADTVQNNVGNVDLIRELECLKQKVEELERDCNELTDENLELVLKLKDLKSIHVEKFASFSSIYSEHPNKSASASSEVSDHEPVTCDLELQKKVNEEETSEFVLEVMKQIEVALQYLMKPFFNGSSDVTEKYNRLLADLADISGKGTLSCESKLLMESTVKCFSELNKILEDRIAEYEAGLKYNELEIQRKSALIVEAEKSLKDQLQELEEQEHSKAKLEGDYSNLLNEFSQQRSEMDRLEAILLRKEDQINSLGLHQRELEDQISELERQKGLMEETSRTVQDESNIMSKDLNGLRNELAVASSSLESHVSAKKILEKKVSDLEMEKHELENKHIKLEDEILQAQEHISNLNLQSRHLKHELESCQLELQNSHSLSMNLQVQIRNTEIEIETQKRNLEKELHDKEEQLLAVQTECILLKTENQNLLASTLGLSQEHRNLQQLNKELKMKEMELHEQCTRLDAKFEESQKNLLECSQKVEYLERNLALRVEEFALGERNMKSELEALLQENKKEKEKFVQLESLSNNLRLEMSAEVENLHIAVESLNKQLFAAREELEKVESESSIELSSLRADKTELESALQKLQSKLEYTEHELNNLQAEKESEIHSLITEVDTSKQNLAVRSSEHEKLLKKLASYRRSEEKLKTAVNDLELKLTVTDYENQQLREESTNIKVHLQRIADLQDEVSTLKTKVEECKLEKDKLEESLRSISADYENLMAEKGSCVEKIMRLEEVIVEHESCKQKQAFLEEKMLKMESDLREKEAICSQKAEEGSDLSKEMRTDKTHTPNLQSGLSSEMEDRTANSEILHKDSNVVTHEYYQRSKSSLETELRDLRERYTEMSLKYAEVEAQREDLVMKLKTNNGRRMWF